MSYQHVAHRAHRRANVIPLKVQSKMMQAVARGDVHTVKQEILDGEDVNGSDVCLRTYLHLACNFGRQEVVKILLSVGARVDAKDSNWLTALHYACRKNQDIVAAMLIDHEAEIESRDKMWVTPLHVCAANNSLECAKLFIDRVSNINVTDRAGATALHHAAFNGNCDMITFLLKKGCTPNAFDKKSRRPIHYAAAIDNSDSIRLLLQAGAVINAHDKSLKTPLHFAAASGSLNAVQTLLDHGADITSVDWEGNNALHWASLHGHDDVIEELLNRDISLINSANRAGMTALHFAAGSDKGLASLEHLVTYPKNVINVNARDKHKRTAMHLAAKFARLLCLQELLRQDADASASDQYMQTSLHYAVGAGNIQIIDALLEHPAVDPDTKDSSGMTALHHSAFLGLSHVVLHLLQHPVKAASPLIHDITGRPAYFLAALAGDIDSMKSLISVYAESASVADALDNFNRSPLHYAAAAGAAGHECLEYLLNYDIGVIEDTGKYDPFKHESSNDKNAFAIHPKEAVNESGSAFAVNQRDIFGRTPLMYACEFDTDGDSVELLISHAAKVDAMDNSGIFTINYAAAAGKVSALRILLQTFYWNEVTFTVCPSQCAAFYGHSECLEMLLKEGIYENLLKAIEYSRRSSSGCYEVLESYIQSASVQDESMAELTQYLTASDQSFHMQFLSNDTFSDLSQLLDPAMARLSIDNNQSSVADAAADARDAAAADNSCTTRGEMIESKISDSPVISPSEEATKSEPVKVNGSAAEAAATTTPESPVRVNGFALNNNTSCPTNSVAKMNHQKGAGVVGSKDNSNSNITAAVLHSS